MRPGIVIFAPSAPRSLPRRIVASAAALTIAAAAASIPGAVPAWAETIASPRSAEPVLVPAPIEGEMFTTPLASPDTAAAGPEQELEAEEIGSGVASWYGNEFAGRRTASGERFDPKDYTAAHRSLPFGSKVRVTNARTGQSVVVRINDRGPFSHGRLIDVSRAAAAELGLIGPGSGKVSLALLD